MVFSSVTLFNITLVPLIVPSLLVPSVPALMPISPVRPLSVSPAPLPHDPSKKKIVPFSTIIYKMLMFLACFLLARLAICHFTGLFWIITSEVRVTK